MAGYSGTPLAKKLGIKSGAKVGFFGAPPDFEQTLGQLPEGATVSARGSARLDVIVCFVRSLRELERELPRLQRRLDSAGGLWIAWYKKASGVVTDVSENDVRSRALALGLVDNKVCAIDESWSGLRLVVRVRDRPK
jgi:hypothetical protein